jgi:hypothetical protein
MVRARPPRPRAAAHDFRGEREETWRRSRIRFRWRERRPERGNQVGGGASLPLAMVARARVLPFNDSAEDDYLA